MLAVDHGSVLRVKEVPYEDERIVAAGSKHSSPRRIPLYRIDRCRMTSELQEGLAGLSNVKDADQVGVGSEGGKEVRVMG